MQHTVQRYLPTDIWIYPIEIDKNIILSQTTDTI